MLLLVGLGNPGLEYEKTRHNVGFMVVDEIIRHHSFSSFKDKFKGMIASGDIAGEKILLLKPTTFMNLSGESVEAVCSFYKIPAENVIVFHDDMDLPVAKVKVKQGGSPAGHNGLKSIDAHIGPNYWRVRIGIDKPVHKSEVVNWVLTPFDSESQLKLKHVITAISQNIELMIQKNEQTFMNRLIK